LRGHLELLAVGARASPCLPAAQSPPLSLRAHRLPHLSPRAHLRGLPAGRLAPAPERGEPHLARRHLDVTSPHLTPPPPPHPSPLPSAREGEPHMAVPDLPTAARAQGRVALSGEAAPHGFLAAIVADSVYGAGVSGKYVEGCYPR